MLKKYLPLFLAVGAIMFAIQALDRGTDEAIAALASDRIVAKVKARDAAIIAKFAPQLAAKDRELDGLRKDQAKANAAGAVTLRCLVKERDQANAVCKAALAEREALLAKQASDCNERFTAMDAAHSEKYALLEKQDGERISSLGGDLTKAIQENIRLRLQLQRRLAIGPVAGYGPGGAFVGVGIMYEVVRIRPPWR